MPRCGAARGRGYCGRRASRNIQQCQRYARGLAGARRRDEYGARVLRQRFAKARQDVIDRQRVGKGAHRRAGLQTRQRSASQSSAIALQRRESISRASQPSSGGASPDLACSKILRRRALRTSPANRQVARPADLGSSRSGRSASCSATSAPARCMRCRRLSSSPARRSTRSNIFGVLSLIFWALMMVVTVKYVLF